MPPLGVVSIRAGSSSYSINRSVGAAVTTETATGAPAARLLAPLWIPTPPPAYGIERVVRPAWPGLLGDQEELARGAAGL